MGYVADGKLEDFGQVEPLLEAAHRTTERVGALLHARVVHHTPVAKPPPGAEAEWLAARKRAPGTLKESWRMSRVEVSVNGETFAIEVYTLDPVAPHVEYPTRPHMIYPHGPHKLRWWDGAGALHFALAVHHPGTQGSYMMATALQEVAMQWREIGADEMRKWAHEQQALV